MTAKLRFSTYYGFVDTTTEATSLLSSVGAATRAIAADWDPTWTEVTSAMFVGFRKTL